MFVFSLPDSKPEKELTKTKSPTINNISRREVQTKALVFIELPLVPFSYECISCYLSSASHEVGTIFVFFLKLTTKSVWMQVGEKQRI